MERKWHRGVLKRKFPNWERKDGKKKCTKVWKIYSDLNHWKEIMVSFSLFNKNKYYVYSVAVKNRQLPVTFFPVTIPVSGLNCIIRRWHGKWRHTSRYFDRKLQWASELQVSEFCVVIQPKSSMTTPARRRLMRDFKK